MKLHKQFIHLTTFKSTRIVMLLIQLTGLAVLISSAYAGRASHTRYTPPGQDYTCPCTGGYRTYGRKDCVDTYEKLNKQNAYKGLSIQQYAWQCDHMYRWSSSAANKTGGGSGFTSSQSDWLKGLLNHLVDALKGSKPSRKCHEFQIGTRKEYRVATESERTEFHEAINLLKTDMLPGPLGSTNKYDTLVSFHHASVALGAHGGAAFLPWHRIYLIMYEIALKQKRSGVSLLYWDSTIEQGLPNPLLSNLWGPTFMGNADGDVTTGPFANWDATDGRKLTRAAQTIPNELTTPADIQTILDKKRYDEIACGSFECMLLENIHGKAHNYVGGHMGDIFFSPNDPIFWMHHAYIDCIWEEFRQNSQETNIATEYPGNFGQPPHHPQALMAPFNEWVASVKNIEGLSIFITSVCYKCDRRPRCPDCGNTPSLYCDRSDNRCKPYINPNDCGEGTALVPAVIYCDKPVYGNQNYGVNGVYLETEGVSYKGRNQVYYFGDYNNYYNIPQSSNPSTYQPKYAGYFPTRRPRTKYTAAGRKKRQAASEQYKPKAYTADGRQCKIECLSGYRGQTPTYGSCPRSIYIRENTAKKIQRGKRAVDVQSFFYDDIPSAFDEPEPRSDGLSSKRSAEYFQVKCPCDFQQYTYCPTYKPGDETKGCTYNGKYFSEGSSFPSTDRCNTCTCRCGHVSCTEKACGCRYNGQLYSEGSSFPSTDGCNTCTCSGGKVDCTKKICCHWSPWEPWQYRPCSKTCGTGTKYKSRTRRKLPGGPGCPGVSIETGYVNCYVPPSGCKWGKWSRWGPYTKCSVTCGDGNQSKSRTRTRQPSCSGTCNGNSQDTRSRKCTKPPCVDTCPSKTHWKYSAYPPWCCVDGTWHQPHHNNLYKCEKISDGLEIIKSCSYGERFKIFAWNRCHCVPNVSGPGDPDGGK